MPTGAPGVTSPYITLLCMELLPRKVLISKDVAFSLTSVQRFVHQPLSSFSFHTIEFNKPEIILLSILSFLFFLFFFSCKTVNHQVLVLPADGTTTLLICMFCDWKGSAGYSFLMVVLALCSIHHFDRKHFLVPIPIRKNASNQKFLFRTFEKIFCYRPDFF